MQDEMLKELPPFIRLLSKTALLNESMIRTLRDSFKNDPYKPIDEHIVDLGFFSADEVEAARKGQALVEQLRITESQFAVAFYDHVTAQIKLEESLAARGWLNQSSDSQIGQ